ncbi:MAG: type II toxin-antitoxin system VapC family toxin [Opitutaceae bacterium]|nr:type II toxin-antitoxin system VapC family toxin [Opitutaceae bacterium]
MKPLVLDGSAALGLLLPDESHAPGARKLRAALDSATHLHVPAHWWVEMTNGILMAERRKRLTQALGMEVLALLSALNVTTDDGPAERSLPATAALARQHGLTAYDASYLELAIRRGAILASQDGDLLKAAQACGVEVLR